MLAEQNPWHQGSQLPDSLAPPRERSAVSHLTAALLADEPRRFRLVLGPRRVGKTTVMYQMVRRLLARGVAPHRLWWLRLDHPLLIQLPVGKLIRRVAELAKATPEEPAFLFLDEVTYADDWALWLKTAYDERWPVRIVATSSAVAAMRDKRMESGIGRWEEHYLPPYLFPEYLELLGQRPETHGAATLSESIAALCAQPEILAPLGPRLRHYMFTGGFPELLLRQGGPPSDDAVALLESQRILRDDAVVRVVWKDIPQAFDVNNPMALERLLYTLAGQIGGLFSPESACQTVRDITASTCERYVRHLELAYLVFTLQAYSPREESRQRRGRKVYFVDAAVRNAALQRGLAPLSDPPELGLMFENLAASHLHALTQQGLGRTFYWRDGKREVDLIQDDPSAPLAFEIASSVGHSRDGLRTLMDHHPEFRGRCYLAVPGIATATPPSEATGMIGEIPLELLLLAAGQQAERGLFNRIGPGTGSLF